MTTLDKFLSAVEIIDSIPHNGTFQPSDDLMLKLYAFHKQATVGSCNIPKPSFWDFSARTRWYAWNELGNMPKEVAMEKYVEELTKVIETMSYNEKVSKFISLIGPFYEFVPGEETDSQKSSYGNEAEYFFPRTMLHTIQENKNLHQETLPCQFFNQNKDSCNYDSIPRNNVTVSTMNPDCDHTSASQIVSIVTERNAINIFKAKRSVRTQPFSSQRDLLVLTVINLQNSLEDIVKKLEKLQNLAKDASTKSHKLEKELVNPQGWSLNFAGTAFALLWPLAVHLYMGGL